MSLSVYDVPLPPTKHSPSFFKKQPSCRQLTFVEGALMVQPSRPKGTMGLWIITKLQKMEGTIELIEF